MPHIFSTWFRKRIPFVVCIALFVALGYIAFVSRLAYLEAQLQLQREQRAGAALATSLWRYGTIESMDAEQGFMVISTENRFYPNAGYTKNLVRITGDTVIAKQELTGASGVYTGLTAPAKSDIGALKSGDLVALLLENRPEEGRIVARMILFGSPL